MSVIFYLTRGIYLVLNPQKIIFSPTFSTRIAARTLKKFAAAGGYMGGRAPLKENVWEFGLLAYQLINGKILNPSDSVYE